MRIMETFRTLLRLYPCDYRALFAPEMQNAFQRGVEERRLRGRPALARFVLGEFAGLLIGALAEWFAKFTTDRSVRGRCLPDLRMMRPVGVPKEIWFGPYPSTAPDQLRRLRQKHGIVDTGE